MTAPYINGQTIEIEPSAMTPVINPANGKAFSKVFMGRPEHVTRAIDAAWAVKDVWGNTLPSERELILIRAADVLESMRSEVVDILIEEGWFDLRQGPPRSLRRNRDSPFRGRRMPPHHGANDSLRRPRPHIDGHSPPSGRGRGHRAF